MTRSIAQLSLAALVVLAVVLVASPAFAESSSLDEELEEYWATERDVDVIEDRLYEREGRFGIGISAGFISSEPFVYYFPLGGNITYFISNAFGLEVGGSFMDAGFLNHPTELTEFLEEERGEAFDLATDGADRFLWRANAMALWSPFYGKIAALQQKMLHFDLNLGMGLGAVGMERPAVDRSEAITATTGEVVFGVGAHFYVHDNINVRLDGRGYLHRGAELPTNEGQFFRQLNFPAEFQLGMTYLF